MGGYCLVTRTSSESIFITELSSIDLLGFSFHFNKYDELISAIGTPVRQILAAASRLYSWQLECFARNDNSVMTMPRNKLIEERIELRRLQPLDRLPRWPHFHHVGWAVYEWPFA
jgi:hypothetical protein